MGRRALAVGEAPAESSTVSLNSRLRSEVCLVLGSLNHSPHIYLYIYVFICVLGLCRATRSEHQHRILASFGLKFDPLGAAWKKAGGCWMFLILVSVLISPSLLGAVPPQELVEVTHGHCSESHSVSQIPPASL